MKEAQAMRYGGLFVQASECDYTSFKHQGLLCPICKKSVFLVAGSERSPHQRTLKSGAVSEVKLAKVDAYFAHHPDTDKTSVEACELRSTQITQAQKALVAAQSRGQRQKALQAHCWKILKTSIALVDIDNTPTLLYSLWEVATKHYREEKAAKRMYQLLIKNLCDQFRIPANISYIKSISGARIEQWVAIQQEFFVHPTLHPMFETWQSHLDLKMQEAITCEVLDFVSQIRQNPILSTLIEQAVYNFILTDAINLRTKQHGIEQTIRHFNNIDLINDHSVLKNMLSITQDLTRMNQERFGDLFMYVCEDVSQSIFLTNWASEFQRLEDLELSRAK